MESKKSVIRTCRLSEELMLHEILTKLPTKSVIRFKSVSKTWLSLISQYSSLIAAKHTAAGEKPGYIIAVPYSDKSNLFDIDTCNKVFFLGQNDSNLVEIDTSYVYRKNPMTIFIVGSCNGLVCLQLLFPGGTHDLVMWNPATREVNYLPTSRDKPSYAIYALGHDPQSGVDKVLRLEEDCLFLKAHVFYQKSGGGGGGWRKVKSSPGFLSFHFINLPAGECGRLNIGGAIYWLSCQRFEILSFDLSKEEFGEFDGPFQVGTEYFHRDLVKWKGFLGAVLVQPRGAEFQVWLKNKDSSTTYSGWRRILTIQPSLGTLFFERVLSGGQIILTSLGDNGAKKEILYDLATNEITDLEPGFLVKLWRSDIFEHFHTLISPN